VAWGPWLFGLFTIYWCSFLWIFKTNILERFQHITCVLVPLHTSTQARIIRPVWMPEQDSRFKTKILLKRYGNLFWRLSLSRVPLYYAFHWYVHSAFFLASERRSTVDVRKWEKMRSAHISEMRSNYES
jgi:hypothetical protein